MRRQSSVTSGNSALQSNTYMAPRQNKAIDIMVLNDHLLLRIEREAAGAPASLLRRHIEQVRAGRAAASYEVRVHAAALLLKLENQLRSESAEEPRAPDEPDYLAPWIDMPSPDNLRLRMDFPIPPSDISGGRIEDFSARR